MTDQSQPHREIKELRKRISRLAAALGRISASLDLDTVLREVIDNARALTGAHHGIIATVDDAGEPDDFTTSGITAAEHRRLMECPDGPRLFAHFRDLPGPNRLDDVGSHVRALGLCADRLPTLYLSRTTFLSTPMRHRGVHVGSFFLGGKKNGEAFTNEDEEIVVMFAAQAATAVANARTHQAEQRARADLAALVETTPIGVAVFDAATGRLVSLNREANRIVQSLGRPGQPWEQLLREDVTCRRADGREMGLDPFPWRPIRATRRRFAPRRSCSRCPTGGASRRWSTRRRSRPRTARWLRWWSPCRT